MRVEVGSGVGIAVHELGAGPPVVLVPGFGFDHRVWDRQVRVLTEAGRRVVCVDQRGHGDSDKPLAGYSVEELARDLGAVLDAVLDGPCTLVGWSFAGQVGFRLAAERPDLVARLALVCSNGVRATRSDDFPFGGKPADLERLMVEAERADRIAARRTAITPGFAAAPDPALVDWLVGISLAMPSWSAVACHRAMLHADLVADIPRVTQPVLQLVGAADPVFSARGARWLAERLADTRLVELADCGHYPLFERPTEFDEALLGFV
ncbi:alpha/beta fold hydrolase [Pseudonocardia pini]|uniref:alpha/beta fold hydrolase n=1 Tax=Pseudonocardia pini TaxID=2758030 RepID=UPI0015F046EF|nr:alpha/beta hydrolase [Pseudonocardia pini]